MCYHIIYHNTKMLISKYYFAIFFKYYRFVIDFLAIKLSFLDKI